MKKNKKNFEKLLNLSGVLLGGKAPCLKMGIFKP
jgi:hypothetical protein